MKDRDDKDQQVNQSAPPTQQHPSENPMPSKARQEESINKPSRNVDPPTAQVESGQSRAQGHKLHQKVNAPITINWHEGAVQTLEIEEGSAITLQNGLLGNRYTLLFKNMSLGSKLISWPNNVKFPNNVKAVLPNQERRISRIDLIFDGETYWANTWPDYHE